MPKVSVLIPIYNVEKYIERCAKSLFKQTLTDIEYVFVNDCTSDKSIDILYKVIDAYPSRRNQIKIINHPFNKGLAAARNTGISASCGEYFIHCDSDDWVEPEMYEELYIKAIEDNADIVTSDFWRDRPLHSSYDKQVSYDNPHDNIKSIFYKENHAGNCTKLIKRDFYLKHQIKFIEGINIWEDVLMASKIFYFAKKISHINKAYYHYEKNSTGYLANFNENALNQLVLAASEIDKFYIENHALKEFQHSINTLKLFIKYIHFREGDKKAISLYSELNDSIFNSRLKSTRKIKLWIITRCPFLLPILRNI